MVKRRKDTAIVILLSKTGFFTLVDLALQKSNRRKEWSRIKELYVCLHLYQITTNHLLIFLKLSHLI
jgi:hypothetical protein